MISEECSGGHWEAVSMCLGEGDCSPGAVENRVGDRCGEEQRICSETCVWSDWSTVVPEGQCEPGMVYPCGLPGPGWVCSDECIRDPHPDCPE